MEHQVTIGKSDDVEDLVVEYSFKAKNDKEYEIQGNYHSRYICFLHSSLEFREDSNGERGFWAKEDIPSGTQVLHETPSILLNGKGHDTQCYGRYLVSRNIDLNHPIFKELSPRFEDEFVKECIRNIAMSGKAWDTNYRDIKRLVMCNLKLARNGFMGPGEEFYLLKNASIFNHSCAPNAEWNIGGLQPSDDKESANDPALNNIIKGLVPLFFCTTTKLVKKGQEIRICYHPRLKNRLSTAKRRQLMKKNLMISKCNCPVCDGDYQKKAKKK
jgi:hypothetical protein